MSVFQAGITRMLDCVCSLYLSLKREETPNGYIPMIWKVKIITVQIIENYKQGHDVNKSQLLSIFNVPKTVFLKNFFI